MVCTIKKLKTLGKKAIGEGLVFLSTNQIGRAGLNSVGFSCAPQYSDSIVKSFDKQLDIRKICRLAKLQKIQ